MWCYNPGPPCTFVSCREGGNKLQGGGGINLRMPPSLELSCGMPPWNFFVQNGSLGTFPLEIVMGG